MPAERSLSATRTLPAAFAAALLAFAALFFAAMPQALATDFATVEAAPGGSAIKAELIEISDNSASIKFSCTAFDSNSDDSVIALYQVRASSEDAPGAVTNIMGAMRAMQSSTAVDTWKRVAPAESGFGTFSQVTSEAEDAADDEKPLTETVEDLQPGTSYTLYIEAYPFNTTDTNRDVAGSVASLSFTTTGIGIDSVTAEISALASGGFDADAVAAARADYNALSEEQRAQVSNTGVLTAAEAVVSARAEATEAKTEAEQAKADAQDAADKQAEAEAAATEAQQKQAAAEAAATEAQQKQAAAEAAATEAQQKQAAAEASLAKYQKASSKKANTITATASKKAVSYKALKKKAKKVAIKVSKAKGAVTFAKAKKTGKYKKVAVSSKGKVTFKKGAKKGTYSFKVKAAGNSSYKAKTVTVKIKVK